MVLRSSTTRNVAALFLGGGLVFSNNVSALQFEIGDVWGSLDSFITLGAAWRTEERDPELVAKVNLQPGLCTGANTTENPNAGSREYYSAEDYESRGLIGGTCTSPTDPSLNLAYVNAPGSYNINGDDGNLNFDRGDIVSAAAKLNSKLNLSWGDFTFFARGIWLFNETYLGFDEFHPDTTLQAPTTALDPGAVDDFGTHFELQDAYISTYQTILGQDFSFRVGRQGLNWGESTALPLNSINTVNPPDQVRQRTPGFDLIELFRPVGMAVIGTDISLNLSLEAFYQYEWLPARVDAPGTFFSQSDVLGGNDSDGYFAMLSFGKAPEDPQSLYASEDNGEDALSLISGASRTIYRLPDQNPKDTGQYGIALRYFAENFNNGTELAFYFANYHSRIPSASFIAAQETCAADSTNQVEFGLDCGLGLGSNGTLMASGEAFPVDTAALFLEYPEDIRMFGVSFNTTVGGWALSGEYSFRPNLPTQVHTVDLLFAALQPALPRHNISFGLPPTLEPVGDLLEPVTGDAVPATVLPSRRAALPDYVQTIYRQQEVQPGAYIRGFERLKQGQLTTTLLKTFGGDNLLRASQILLVAEAGLTHIVDMPSLSEVQFQGGETNTHISRGADGTINEGITDSAIATNATNTQGDGDPRCERQTYDSIGGAEAESCRQNPTAEDPDKFGTEFSSGVRILSLIRYQDFFAGVNFEPLLALFYDIDGIGPGLGQNFQEGRTTALLGLRFDYLSRWFGEVRYTYLDGDLNAQRDRDNIAVTVRYEF